MSEYGSSASTIMTCCPQRELETTIMPVTWSLFKGVVHHMHISIACDNCVHHVMSMFNLDKYCMRTCIFWIRRIHLPSISKLATPTSQSLDTYCSQYTSRMPNIVGEQERARCNNLPGMIGLVDALYTWIADLITITRGAKPQFWITSCNVHSLRLASQCLHVHAYCKIVGRAC